MSRLILDRDDFLEAREYIHKIACVFHSGRIPLTGKEVSLLDNRLWTIIFYGREKNYDLRKCLGEESKKDISIIAEKIFLYNCPFGWVKRNLARIMKEIKLKELEKFLFNMVILEEDRGLINFARKALKEINEDAKINA